VNNILSDFFEFAGLSYGNTVDQVFDVYGVPDDEYRNEENSYFVFYYEMYDEYSLNISFSTHTFKIESIFLGLHSFRAVKALLLKCNVEEPKSGFLGSNMDEIIDCFGTPHDWHQNYISYRMKNLEVEFWCPIDERYICRRIKVKWFTDEK
jgi:hypothetical protein